MGLPHFLFFNFVEYLRNSRFLKTEENDVQEGYISGSFLNRDDYTSERKLTGQFLIIIREWRGERDSNSRVLLGQ